MIPQLIDALHGETACEVDVEVHLLVPLLDVHTHLDCFV